MAHAAHHVVTEQLLAEKAAADEAELAALEERLENEPATKKTVSGRMRIEELLNPAPPVALKTRPIPTFLVAGQPISRQSLVDQRTGTAQQPGCILRLTANPRRMAGISTANFHSITLRTNSKKLWSRASLCVLRRPSRKADTAAGLRLGTRRNGRLVAKFMSPSVTLLVGSLAF
jgi:hypothetical protein